jgi:hypothetical protein
VDVFVFDAEKGVFVLKEAKSNSFRHDILPFSLTCFRFSAGCRGYAYILFEAFIWEAMFELAVKKKGCF